MTNEKLRIDGMGWVVAVRWGYDEHTDEWQCSLTAREKYGDSVGTGALLTESEAAELAEFLESPPGPDE